MASPSTAPRLVDLCEPIFAVICDINRLGRNGVHRNIEAVNNEVTSVFEKVSRSAARSNQQERQWKEVEPALCCFVDSMIENSNLPEAREWREHRLAESRFKILTGEDAFFDEFLDKELEAPTGDSESAERLEVYFACLYLGFEGKHYGVPDKLQKVQAKVAGRVKRLLGNGLESRITPAAYENLNETKLNLDSAPAIWGAVILSVFFVVLFFFGTTYMYRQAMSDLTTSVQAINEAK
jgi:type IV/VI secretion system ImpK/VasF family protein